MIAEMSPLEETKVQQLRDGFGGDVLRQNDDGYETSRRIWNGLIDRHPALIARCTGVADVMRAVHFAREHNLAASVRGGGHNVSGKAVSDGGLVIDLSRMRCVRVAPAGLAAHAQGGCTLADLDRETQAFGLATPAGTVSPTGIAGLTLGGGLGWLMGRWGLTCDNVRCFDVVTADGTFVQASPEEHADLYWGLRGGGGNFGVVTSFEYQLYRLGQLVYSGLFVYSMEHAREVLRLYRELTAECPDELTVYAALLTWPDSQSCIAIIPCFSGEPLEQGERLVSPFRKIAPLVVDAVQTTTFLATQKMLDAGAPWGSLNYWKSHFVTSFHDGLIDALVATGSRRPSPMSVVLIEHLHGAAARVAPDATAFVRRGNSYNVSPMSIWLDPATSDAQIAWASACAAAIAPFSTGDVYVNYLDQDEPERVPAAYGGNYARLQALKRKYDPDNFFRLNQNIGPRPAGPPT